MALNPATITSSLSNTLGTYLNQWCKVASGGRVYLAGSVHTGPWSSGSSGGYLIFKCNVCNDNWHVGKENFTANGQEAVPSVLQDWVKKHRHVCKKYQSSVGLGLGEVNGGEYKPPCGSCNWPYGAHEESWIVTPKYAEQLTGSMTKALNSWNSTAQKYDAEATKIKNALIIKAMKANFEVVYSGMPEDDIEPSNSNLKKPEIKIAEQPKGRVFRCVSQDTPEKTSTE